MADSSGLYGLSTSLHGRSSYSESGAFESRPGIDPASASRAQNVRNRTGCLTCKRRKKKCDETKPVCKNCLRTSYVCEGYPPVRYFRNDESSMEPEQGSGDVDSVPKSSASPQSEQDTMLALVAATEQVRILTQRVQQLEQELNSVQRDKAKAAPRLPSLRSMMQPEVMKRYGQLCPTCGQVDRSSSNTDKDSVRQIGSAISSANSPVSTTTSSDADAWSTSMSNYSTVQTSGPETPMSNTFAGSNMISPASSQRPNGQYPMVLPSFQNQNMSRTPCYECRLKNLPCNGAAPCDQCINRALPECSYSVKR